MLPVFGHLALKPLKLMGTWSVAIWMILDDLLIFKTKYWFYLRISFTTD